MSEVKQIDPRELEGFVAGLHQPYTDYDSEIAEWLNYNAENTDFSYSKTDQFIFTSDTGQFYTHNYKFGSDVYYTKEQFKEWIGMVNKQEEKKDMKFTKADLKDGMIVETRRDGRYIVIGECFVELATSTGFNSFNTYDDNLLDSNGNTEYDIVEVYFSQGVCSRNDLRQGKLKSLWKRVEQTPEQIEAERIRKELEKLTEQLKKLEGK